MRNPKTLKSKAKRGFAMLDRDEALKAATGAVGLLRRLFKFATSSAAWRSGLGNALELLELELNDILLFSSTKRLPDNLLCDSEAEATLSNLGDARKEAAGAVKVLQTILRDARADLSVDESQCYGLDCALDRLEEELNRLLPPPGSPPKAKLPAEWFEDDPESATGAADSLRGE
jgi:hypothetical protein